MCDSHLDDPATRRRRCGKVAITLTDMVERKSLERPDGAEDTLLQENFEVITRLAQHLDCIVLGTCEEFVVSKALKAHQRFASCRSQQCFREEDRRCHEGVPVQLA